jgi:hypothetical protein
LGVVWFGLTTRTRSVGLVNTSRSGLEGAEQVPQSAGVIGLMFATVEPSGHVVAGDLPQSAVVDGDLGPGTVGCRPAGRRWCAEDEPAAAGCPSRSTSIQTCRPERPATPARAPVEATKAVGGERRSHAAVVRSGAVADGGGRRQRDCAGCGAGGLPRPGVLLFVYAPGSREDAAEGVLPGLRQGPCAELRTPGGAGCVPGAARSGVEGEIGPVPAPAPDPRCRGRRRWRS